MHSKEHAIAELRALKAAPGMQMHWQEKIDGIIAELNAPAPPPPTLPKMDVETEKEAVKKADAPKWEAPKSKVTTAAHVMPAKTKGK